MDKISTPPAGIDTIPDLINLWPTRAELARDLNEACPELGVKTDAVHNWAKHNSIKAKYLHPLIACGQARGFDIDADLLVRLHSPKPAERAA